MTKQKHTPGPWIATTNRYPDGQYNGRPYVYSSKHGHIAEAFMVEAGEANARLIAAAPELLQALRYMVETACPESERGSLPNSIVNGLSLCEAAIAKAEKGGVL